MKVRLLYFARLREVFATGQETPELPPAVRTLADLLDWLRQRGGTWAEELAEGRAYRVAINQDLAERDAVLHENDEIALFPPVTGG
jgi:molybdopterin synthase sulfur carrier subunit